MSTILPPTAAPAPSATPGARTTLRSDETDPNNPGSFGEALARSLEPAEEKIEKPAVKAANTAPTKRQPGNPKADAQDLVNVLALSLIPFESRIAKAALPDGAGPAAGSAAPVTTAALLAASGSALAGSPLAEIPPPTVAPGDGAAMTASADAPSTRAALLTAGSQNSAGQASLQAADAPVPDGAALQIDPLAIANQTATADAGFTGQISKRNDKIATILGEPRDARGDPAPVSAPGIRKVAENLAAPDLETASLPVTGLPVAADVATNTSAAGTMAPVNMAMHAPGSALEANAPASVDTVALAPEVGSNEWGKALGQQVVRMGAAGPHVAELQLNPPGLGPLKVTLSMNELQMQVMFVSSHSSVRAAVEAALPQLRATLADSGISLGNTSVGAGSHQQAAFASGQGGQSERGAYRPAQVPDTAAFLPARTVTEPARKNNGTRIDIYA
jgi:flagellar hook-length control protein FliK